MRRKESSKMRDDVDVPLWDRETTQEPDAMEAEIIAMLVEGRSDIVEVIRHRYPQANRETFLMHAYRALRSPAVLEARCRELRNAWR
jgi:hypothetical protein